MPYCTQQGFAYKAIMIKINNDDDDDDDDDNDADDDDDNDDVSYSERFCILVHPPQVRSTTPVKSRCSSFKNICQHCRLHHISRYQDISRIMWR